jgi:excisionase family DNA binding protein
MSADVTELNLLTIREASALLRQSERSIRRKVHAGLIPALRLGETGPLRVPLTALEDHLEPVDVSTDGLRQEQLRPAQSPSERRGTQTMRGQSNPQAHPGPGREEP